MTTPTSTSTSSGSTERTLRLAGLSDDELACRLSFHPTSVKITSVSPHHLPLVLHWLAQERATLRHVEFTNVDFGDAAGAAADEEDLLEWMAPLLTLGLNRCRIRPAQARLVLSALLRANRVETLNLSMNPLGDEGARALARFLEANTSLRELYIHRTQIGDEGARLLFTSLGGGGKGSRSSGLEVINFQNNRLTSATAANALTWCVTVHSLILASSALSSSAVDALAQLLRRPDSALQYVDLSDNALTSEMLQPALVSALRDENTKLHSLMLSGNRLGDEGAIALARVLCHPRPPGKPPSALQTLDLALNDIGLEGALALRQAVREAAPRGCCPHFVDLGLVGNRALPRQLQVGIQVTVGLAAQARRVLVLREAAERRNRAAAVRRLPREMCFLVLQMLAPTHHGVDEAMELEEEDER